MSEYIEKLKKRFSELFGGLENTREYFSPGRVNLIGEHTDYNGGHVFPCALTLGTYAIARRRDDDKIMLYSENVSKAGVITLSKDNIELNGSYGWAAYPIGVVWAFEKQGYRIDSGFEMALYGDIPNGSGLSSSASIEVLTGAVLRDLYSFDGVTGVDLAKIGQYSENNFNGVKCGIMDQFAVAMGKKDHAIFLDTATLKYEYAPVILKDASIVIVNSNVKHSLVDSAYNERRSQCAEALSDLQSVLDIRTLGDIDEETFEKNRGAIKDETVRRRAKHAVYENQRTIRAVKALSENDIALFGKLMDESHISLRDDYEVSCEEIDFLVDTAHSVKGVIGSRITGGGFGGCTVNIVKNEALDEFKEKIKKDYLEKYSKEPGIYQVSIGDGAGRI
ncbi:MAG: galactokinase [Lachnospiraceae bacterium]|nr:galactokinase [Lachnospiraceae bacterium]